MNQEEIMQQLQAAVQAYQGKDLNSAEAIFKQILAINPKEPNALHLLGCIHKGRGQLQQAVELIQASIQVDGSNPIPFLNLGKILSIAGQHENAAGVFQESLKRNQQIPETWFCFANALKEMEKVEEAKQAYRNALQLNPAHAGAASNLGALLTDDGELEEAEQLFSKALEHAPANVNLRINYGKLLAEKNEHTAAIAQYQIALPLAPQSPELHYNFANALKEEGEVEEAIASYRKAVEVKPDFADAYFNLGNALKEEGKVEEAIASYRKAIEVKPDFADAYLNLGNALKEEGKVEEAIASYRKAIEVKPDFADAYLNLANVLKEEGEAEDAADAFAEHYRLKPIAQSFSFASAVASQPLNTQSVVKVPEGAEFIPSYVSDAIPFGMHMMYVHIPKAGGIRFSSPIFSCIQELLLQGGWQKHPELAAAAFGRERVSVMASHRIDSAPMRDGIVAAFSSYDLPSLDFSFLTPHGVSSRELSLAMRDQFDVQPIRLATWRDPEKRLKSALDYLYRTSEGDLGLVREKIDQKDPFLDNAICRGCFSVFSPHVSSDDLHDAQVDHLIDIGDFSVMNQIMSSFLSRCRLPNVIVNKKVNVTSADKKMDAEIADSLMGQCVDSEFISMDGVSEVEQMVSKGLPAEFDLKVDPASASLHPLTFVVSAATDVKTSLNHCFLPTECLLTDEGQEFLRKTFA